MDERALAQAVARYRLALPRQPRAGRLGELASRHAGSALELHDFRAYQPGDDVRQLDWNATARTGQPIIRVRQAEVSPRAEVWLDVSRSMGISDAKRERARELTALFARLARAQGLSPSVSTLGDPPRPIEGEPPEVFDAASSLARSVGRARLRPCGLRLVVSDFLFEEPPSPTFNRLGEGAGALALVQVLDGEDLEPSPGPGARLLDSESDAALDRFPDAALLARYRKRLEAHQAALRDAARRARAELVLASAAHGLTVNLERSLLGPVLEPRGKA